MRAATCVIRAFDIYYQTINSGVYEECSIPTVIGIFMQMRYIDRRWEHEKSHGLFSRERARIKSSFSRETLIEAVRNRSVYTYRSDGPDSFCTRSE